MSTVDPYFLFKLFLSPACYSRGRVSLPFRNCQRETVSEITSIIFFYCPGVIQFLGNHFHEKIARAAGDTCTRGKREFQFGTVSVFATTDFLPTVLALNIQVGPNSTPWTIVRPSLLLVYRWLVSGKEGAR